MRIDDDEVEEPIDLWCLDGDWDEIESIRRRHQSHQRAILAAIAVVTLVAAISMLVANVVFEVRF